jgi:cell division protein FtsL
LELIAKLSQVKISDRDKKLILIVIALAILFFVYRFVYYPNVQAADTVQNEILQLKVRQKELQLENDKADQVIKDNKALQSKINSIIEHYGTGASAQKSILFLEGLKLKSGMDISVIDLSSPQTSIISASTDSNPTAATTDSQVSGVTADGGTTDASAKETQGVTATGSMTESADTGQNVTAVNGYDYIVSIDFKVNYEGLRKCIDYINSYPEHMNIKELSIVYDMETGNLSGTMQINMYQLIDTGREEEEPVIAGVTIGNQNLFGTIEVTGEESNN